MADTFNYYIFDLDGTLIDTRKDLTTSVNILRKSYNLSDINIKTVTKMVGDGVKKLVERAVEAANPVDIEEALKIFNDAYAQHLVDNTYIYPGISDVIKKLKNSGKILAINTNKSDRFAIEILKKLGIYKYFDLLIGGSSVNIKKPDPEGLLKIMKTLGSKKSESLMIGDGKNDIIAAKKARIKSAYVMYGYTTVNDVSEFAPDYFITETQEILFI